MTNAVQGVLIEAQRQPAQHEVAGKVESAAEVLPTDRVTAPALWPRYPEGCTASPLRRLAEVQRVPVRRGLLHGRGPEGGARVPVFVSHRPARTQPQPAMP